MEQDELLRRVVEVLEEQGITYSLWAHQVGGPEKHLRDIAAMLQVSGAEIDQEYIAEWAQQLGLMEPWQAVCDWLRDQ